MAGCGLGPQPHLGPTERVELKPTEKAIDELGQAELWQELHRLLRAGSRGRGASPQGRRRGVKPRASAGPKAGKSTGASMRASDAERKSVRAWQRNLPNTCQPDENPPNYSGFDATICFLSRSSFTGTLEPLPRERVPSRPVGVRVPRTTNAARFHPLHAMHGSALFLQLREHAGYGAFSARWTVAHPLADSGACSREAGDPV
jgi:hypothetical protein